MSEKNRKQPKYSEGAKEEIKKEMHRLKKGKAKSGKGKAKVKNRKQAIAIALSRARKKGEEVPEKK